MSKLFESACNITATINIEPSTPVDLNEGDILTEDMFTDSDDEELVNLISIVDTVTVEEVTGANSYKINANITDDIAAVSLYQWIYANTNITSDEDLEAYVAPGLASLVNSDGEGTVADDEDPDATADYESLADETDMYNESVSSKFAKYRKLYEAAHESLNEAEALNDDKDESGEGGGDDDFSDIFGDTNSDSGEGGDDNQDDNGDDDNQDDDSDKDSDEANDKDEDVPMTAVVLTVKKEDADKCKDEMVDAGIPEEDIEIIDGEDEDDNSKIKVDANSVKELKDYLEGKGIDLEEKIGGEIVDDEEDSDEDGDKDKDEDGDDKDKDKDKDDSSDDGDIDDMDFGDIFGDDEESSDENQ